MELVADSKGELWMTARQAAEHCGRDVQTIYSWVRRGHLEAAGLDEYGRKLFRFTDVGEAEYAVRERAKRVLEHRAA